MTSAQTITLCVALIVAAFVVAEAKGKGPSITHKVLHSLNSNLELAL
jgi:hypothetical protein